MLAELRKRGSRRAGAFPTWSNLEAMLAELGKRGARVLERREDTEQGRFGYVVDPHGTLLDLWEPSTSDPSLATG